MRVKTAVAVGAIAVLGLLSGCGHSEYNGTDAAHDATAVCRTHHGIRNISLDGHQKSAVIVCMDGTGVGEGRP
jgi:hypothetical protein